ncbi:hypothetical protein JCM1841_006614 [Sporobolomyces salmonicolor]
MKLLVTGASGLLGRAVFSEARSAGHDVRGTALTRACGDLVKLDLTDEMAVKALLEQYKPEVVIHCAAERRPDAVEQNPEEAKKLNIGASALLSRLSLAPSHPFTLIYISTDYVFDGHAPPSGYEPNDATNPTNLYGESKLSGEKAVLEGLGKGGKACSLRIPVLYGPASTPDESSINVLLEITRSAAQGKSVKMDNWATRYPTCVTDIGRVLVDLAAKSLTTPLPPVLHFSAQQLFTKYTICQLLAQLHSPPLELGENFISVDAGPQAGETVRPKDCHLSNHAIEELGIDTTTVDFAQWWKQWITSH